MTLQEWLEQEYDAWIKEGMPGGWSSGWVQVGVNIYLPELASDKAFNPKVIIDSDGQINISLRPIGR